MHDLEARIVDVAQRLREMSHPDIADELLAIATDAHEYTPPRGQAAHSVEKARNGERSVYIRLGAWRGLGDDTTIHLALREHDAPGCGFHVRVSDDEASSYGHPRLHRLLSNVLEKTLVA
jgi:hypothetical protein